MSIKAAELSQPIVGLSAENIHFRLGYRPALDGIRGVAILSVLAVHTKHLFGWPLIKGGNIGVDIFFVLSGFLITALLLEEWNQTGTVSIKHFYTRRVLRLVPALTTLLIALYVAAGFVLPPFEAKQAREAVPIAFLYASDFAMAFFPTIQLGPLQHTWSLAIEEHFYLIWPLFLVVSLKLGLSGKRLLLITLLLVAASVLQRTMLWEINANPLRTYYGIDTRADALLIGCATALALYWGYVGSCGRLTALAVIFIALLMLTTDYSTPAMHLGGFTALAVASAIVIVNVILAPPSIAKSMLEFPALVWTGRLSYGIYLWHYPLFKMVKYLEISSPAKLFLAIAATFSAAALSFYLIERPALRLKARSALGARASLPAMSADRREKTFRYRPG